DHVAVDRDLPLAEFRKIDDGAQRASNQALDLLRPPGLVADRRFAPGAFTRGAGQHAVFSGHPAAALSLEPRRQALLEARRAEDVGIAKLDQARALGVHGNGAFEGNAAQLVGLAFGGAHASLSFARIVRGTYGRGRG